MFLDVEMLTFIYFVILFVHLCFQDVPLYKSLHYLLLEEKRRAHQQWGTEAAWRLFPKGPYVPAKQTARGERVCATLRRGITQVSEFNSFLPSTETDCRLHKHLPTPRNERSFVKRLLEDLNSWFLFPVWILFRVCWHYISLQTLPYFSPLKKTKTKTPESMLNRENLENTENKRNKVINYPATKENLCCYFSVFPTNTISFILLCCMLSSHCKM